MKKNTLRSYERLKHRKSIEFVFSPKSITLYEKGLCLRYITFDKTKYPVQVGFSVSKRFYKKAHDRNQFKRWLREAYRLRKAELYHIADEKQISIALFLIIHRKWEDVQFKEIERALENLLRKLILKLKDLESQNL